MTATDAEGLPAPAAGEPPDRASARLRALLDHLPCGVVCCRGDEADEVGAYVVAESNAAYAALTGQRSPIGRRLRDLLPDLDPDDPAQLARCAEVVRTGIPARFEAWVAGRDRWFAVVAYRAGRRELTIVFEDITARRQAVHARRRAHERFAAAFHGNAAAQVITRLDDGRIVDCNAQYLAVTGLARAEAIGRTALELGQVTEAQRDELAATIHTRGARDAGRPVEVEIAARGGARKTLLLSFDLIDLDDEGPCTLSTFVDVTARRRAEQALAMAFHGNAAALVISRASDRAIVDVNARFLRLVGYRRDEVLGKTSLELGLISERTSRELMATMSSRAAGAPVEVEVAIVLRTGETRTILAQVEQVELEGDGPCILTTCVDVTERRRAERLFQAAFHDNASAMVISRAADSTIVDANDRYLEMVGVTRAAAIGRPVDLGLPEWRGAVAHELLAGPRSLELARPSSTGGTITVIATSQRLELAGDGACTLTSFVDITARRRAEEAFQKAFHAGPAGMLLVRAACSTIAEINDRLLDMTGYTRDELVGTLPRDLVVVPIAPRAAAGEQATPKVHEVELRHKSGALRTTLVSAETIMIGDEPHRLSLFVDISERKRVERRLATQQACTRVLAVTEGVDAMAPEVLDALCRGDGWDFGVLWIRDPADGLLHASGLWHAPELAAGALVATLRTMALPADKFSSQVMQRRAVMSASIDGGQFARPELLLACGLRHALGVPIGSGDQVFGVLALGARERGELDVAEREMFAALGDKLGRFIARARADAALRASEQRMRLVVDALHEGLVIADPRGQVAYWNPAALRMHELESPGELARPIAEFPSTYELATLDGELVPFARWPVTRIAAGEVLRGCEYVVRRRDRAWQRVVGYGGTLIRQADGRELAVLTITDVTERVAATTAVRELNAELELRVAVRTAELAATNRELEAFSYSVSHDLRAPLRAINGFSAILLDEHAAGLTPEAIRLLTTIHDSGRRLGALTDDLLAFSQLGRAALRLRPVDLEELVRDVAAELTQGLGARRVELRVAALPDTTADPSLLRQVWVNLLDNALKYTRGRDPAVLEITSTRVGGTDAFHVRDNGVGFDMRYAQHLFGVFQRLHSAAEFEGTGVGLATVRRIVERHGGRIWGSSELGRGSTFSFTIAPEAGA